MAKVMRTDQEACRAPNTHHSHWIRINDHRDGELYYQTRIDPEGNYPYSIPDYVRGKVIVTETCEAP